MFTWNKFILLKENVRIWDIICYFWILWQPQKYDSVFPLIFTHCSVRTWWPVFYILMCYSEPGCRYRLCANVTYSPFKNCTLVVTHHWLASMKCLWKMKGMMINLIIAIYMLLESIICYHKNELNFWDLLPLKNSLKSFGIIF